MLLGQESTVSKTPYKGNMLMVELHAIVLTMMIVGVCHRDEWKYRRIDEVEVKDRRGQNRHHDAATRDGQVCFRPTGPSVEVLSPEGTFTNLNHIGHVL
jgi:hypothetical protein